ncbi:MAG: glycoside hydrolase family 5 protein [Treponema sp.]|jgi:endoglucanase|nr:glycoside hydrolase family 5 protein [Treponema sp.]
MKKVKLKTIVCLNLLVAGILFSACKPASKTEVEASGSFGDISAVELAGNIKIGWNLGNTLDTTDLFWLARNASVRQFETAWGNPVTTKEMLDAVWNAGFNAVRIPVSWAKCADGNYAIRGDWMDRVRQVVDYAVSCGMYVIINSHHDDDIFGLLDTEMEESKLAIKRIWEQIAETFRDYDEKLIFEGMNEPRTKGSPNEWNGGTAEERANLNVLNQLFVDTVRASGGNNVARVLMIPSYAASSTAAAMEAVVIPEDPLNAVNKIIVSIHAYEPYNFSLNENSPVAAWSAANPSDTSPIIERIGRAFNLFVSRGFPVIMGEFGALDKGNEDARAEWAEYYVRYAKSRGIKCFWWDNGGEFRLFDRRSNALVFPRIVEALMGGAE